VPARKTHDPALIARARSGALTRTNTVAGSSERQAVDRVQYERRLAMRRPDETARQALAHPRAGDTLQRWGVFVDDPPRWVELEMRPREGRRVARYLSLAGRLADYPKNGFRRAEFARKVSAWRPLPNGMRFLADPDAVLALVEQRRALDLEVFYYESGRA
jgi:hypothetical protein